jgi:flagellar motor switch protein FliG
MNNELEFMADLLGQFLGKEDPKDIARLPDQDIEQLWDRVDPTDMALALRAVDEKVSERLLSRMAASFRTQVHEAPTASGPVMIAVVEDAQLRIVQQMRVLEEQGMVSIVRGDRGVGDHIL